MYQFTATLSGSYPYEQQQTHKVHGVQEYGWNQNSGRSQGPSIRQDFQDQPGRTSFFGSAEYAEPRTFDDCLGQTDTTPFQRSPKPMSKRDPHAQERQPMAYDDRQPPSAYNALTNQRIPAQNAVHRNATLPPPVMNEDPIRRLEYPSVENRLLGVTYGSFGSLRGENHRKKAPRVSQACEQCRQAKAKCQDEKPCRTCVDTKQNCVYTIPKTADEKDLSTITIRLDRQEDLMRRILIHVTGLEAELNIIHPATNFNVSVEQPKNDDLGVSSNQNSPSPFGSHGFESFKIEEAGPTLLGFGPAVPLYHTTAASFILSWRSIQGIVGETLPDVVTRDVTMDSARHGQTKKESVRDSHNSEPDLKSDTISKLINLYMNHFNVIHPILSPRRLKGLFMRFVKSSNSVRLTSKACIEEAQRLKRKRPVGDAEAPNDAVIGSKMPEPSIELALFLLVLALGKIYDPTEKPHAFHEGGEKPCGSAPPRNSYSSPEEVERSWTHCHPSVNGNVPQKLGSMDITPGLDYFAAATNIIGKVNDRDSQCYVQVQILTSLYQRQLGQLSKCHAAISEAARALQALLRSKNTQSGTTGLDNALIIVFWTCLTIESEIIAELPVPQSNLDSWEQFMPWPNVEGEEFVSTVQGDGYNTQLQVRRHINTILPILYGHGHHDNVDKVSLEELATSSIVQSTIDHLEAYLSKMTQPPTSESSDSLTARLNAKILAAKAITLRPYLMRVLNREHAESETVQNYAKLCIETLHRGANAFNYYKGDQLVAYAQCGNIMILLAAFCDASLKHLITSDLLGDLAKQALNSLMAWPSSELAQKYVKVLKAMTMKAGLYE